MDPEHAEVYGFSLLAPCRPASRCGWRTPVSGFRRERTKVFDAFYEVDSSSTREYGGTGLGLSIVKRLVEAHGGAIHIEANQPQGTVFVVRLPVGGAEESD